MTETHVIFGPPGAGKTSTIAHQVERALNAGYQPQDIDIRSLTRSAAKVAAGRIDLPEGRIGTLHSAAFRALGVKRDQVVGVKNIREFSAEHPEFSLRDAADDFDDAYPVERSFGMSYGDCCRTIMDIHRARMTPREQWPHEIRPFADAWFDWLKQCELIDFTGMLERAITDTYNLPGTPPLMFIDEGQDFSRLGFELIRHWSQDAEKLLVVGDGAQCLYAWAGSNPDDFANFSENRHVLKQSHRLPRSVHAFSVAIAASQLQRWGVRFEPRNAEGMVDERTVFSHHPESIVEYCCSAAAAGRSAMILASCSYMLDPVIAVLRKSGIPFSNPWRPTRGDWNPLRTTARKVLEFLTGDQRDIKRMEWMKDLQASALARGVKTQLTSKQSDVPTPAQFRDWVSLFADEANAVKALGERSLAWLISNVEPKRHRSYDYAANVARLHGAAALQEAPRLHVGTVHSIKGGEADVVAVFPDLSKQGWEEMSLRDREAVDRVFYVACTRAKEELILCRGGLRSYRW